MVTWWIVAILRSGSTTNTAICFMFLDSLVYFCDGERGYLGYVDINSTQPSARILIESVGTMLNGVAVNQKGDLFFSAWNDKWVNIVLIITFPLSKMKLPLRMGNFSSIFVLLYLFINFTWRQLTRSARTLVNVFLDIETLSKMSIWSLTNGRVLKEGAIIHNWRENPKLTFFIVLWICGYSL